MNGGKHLMTLYEIFRKNWTHFEDASVIASFVIHFYTIILFVLLDILWF